MAIDSIHRYDHNSILLPISQKYFINNNNYIFYVQKNYFFIILLCLNSYVIKY